MKSIIYVGMDVHKEAYSMCCYSVENQACFAEIQIESDIKAVMKYLRRIQINYGAPYELICASVKCQNYLNIMIVLSVCVVSKV